MSQSSQQALAQASQQERSLDDSTTTGPTAAYMKARIRALTSILIKEYGEILDVALPASIDEDNEQPQAISEITRRQLTVEAASTAMVRAAEELLILTRTMKELWLFGELDTLDADRSEEEKRQAEKVRRDESAVVKGMQQWISANASSLTKDTSTRRLRAKHEDESDSDDDMAD